MAALFCGWFRSPRAQGAGSQGPSCSVAGGGACVPAAPCVSGAALSRRRLRGGERCAASAQGLVCSQNLDSRVFPPAPPSPVFPGGFTQLRPCD